MPHTPSTTTTTATNLIFYPAYCFSASPTWFTWVKLTCYDVHHALRPRVGFPTTVVLPSNASSQQEKHPPPLLLFYLNHPIQFIQVVGIVVATEDYNHNFYLFTLDDSSGATIDVICWKPKPKPKDEHSITPHSHARNNNLEDGNDDRQTLLNTLTTLTIGTTLVAKGTLTTFRSARQLHLERLAILPSASSSSATQSELSHIAARTQLLQTTLSHPWLVSEQTQSKLRHAAHDDVQRDDQRAKRARERERRREKREMRDRDKIVAEWEDEEKLRAKDAEKVRADGLEVMKKREQDRKRAKKTDSESDQTTIGGQEPGT